MTERSSESQKRFDALFADHGPDVVAYCGWRAASASDAQDAVSDVFLTAWRRLDDVPDDPIASALGATEAPAAPPNARDLLKERLIPASPTP